MPVMTPLRSAILGAALLAAAGMMPPSLRQADFASATPQTAEGPYARLAFLRPHDGHTVDFEAGYIRHLDFHRQAKDAWVWYGWTIWAGDRQRWFVYATFGHSAASLDHPVPPADDERDNVVNVAPHAEFTGNAILEYLPALSRGAARPSPSPRLELTTVEVKPGSQADFEAALQARQPSLADETLWYRMGRRRDHAALRQAARARQPVRDSRRPDRAYPAGSRSPARREGDGRDPESAADAVVWITARTCSSGSVIAIR